MDKLSVEIVWEVLGNLNSKSDLGNFRLVQRSFAPLALESLFRSIIIRNSRYSFSHLLKISRRPELAGHVKEVILEISSSANYLVWPQFTERLQKENKHEDESQKDRALVIFRYCIKEWYTFQKSQDYVAILSAAFVRLPRLQNLALEQGDGYSLGLRLDFSHIRRYPFRKRSNYHGSGGSADLSRGFTGLINAAYLAEVQLAFFKVVDYSGNFAISNFSSQSSELLERVAIIFSQCRAIELRFNGVAPGLVMNVNSQDALPPWGAFPSSGNLEELHISFQAFNRSVSFPRFFGDAPLWPRLKLLSIESFDLHDHELRSFFLRHSGTLQRVLIHGCILHTGSWVEVTKFMVRTLRLTKLKLSCLYNPRYEVQDSRIIAGLVADRGLVT